MLRIYVLSQNGVAPPMVLAAEFGEGQGSIGRDAHNTLVLPDPHKHISRVQAQIKVDNGASFLIDQGANPTSVNGRPLGKGSVATLHDGDSIEMAEWVLRVEEQAARPVFSAAPVSSASVSNMADPLGLLGAGEAAGGCDPLGLLGIAAVPETPPVPVATPLVPAPVMPQKPFAANPDDPFAVFATAEPSAPQPAVASGPTDDPFAAFAPPPSAAPAVAPSRAGDVLGLGIASGAGESSVDSLFGLAGSSAGDPFGQSALAEPIAHSGDANTDPLALLMGTPVAPSQPVMRQDSPMLADAFVPPQPVPMEEMDLVLNTAAVAPTPTPVPAPAPTPAQPAAAVAPDALMAAFLRGVAMPGLNMPGGMTEELAEHLGGVLREALQGTVELLAARAVTKREMKAEMTMIVSANNNPLKFSPDVGFALHLLFQPQASRGFMTPIEAMRDAYDDLRAHQIGFVAGMRAALEGVLARFRPEELEGRLSDRSFLDSVLPANRKAKLWDLYEQRYVDVLREAEDDFNSLFGREFLRAYEEQIENLKADRETGR